MYLLLTEALSSCVKELLTTYAITAFSILGLASWHQISVHFVQIHRTGVQFMNKHSPCNDSNFLPEYSDFCLLIYFTVRFHETNHFKPSKLHSQSTVEGQNPLCGVCIWYQFCGTALPWVGGKDKKDSKGVDKMWWVSFHFATESNWLDFTAEIWGVKWKTTVIANVSLPGSSARLHPVESSIAIWLKFNFHQHLKIAKRIGPPCDYFVCTYCTSWRVANPTHTLPLYFVM